MICHHLACQPADILQLITEKEDDKLYPDR
ncbi:MAG TPA: hypothetical protein VFC34_14465 [Puia sp.]|nr:hypothetical protein [Puia sp.]